MFSVFKATKTLLPVPRLNPFLPYARTAFSHFSTDSDCSFTVSYLINSCGLSPESAVSASVEVKFDAPQKPDSVLSLLQAHGFTKAQISKLVQKLPRVLVANPVKSLLPKLEFFQSIGVSKPVLTRMLSGAPYVLNRSLNNSIIPCYNILKTLLGSDEKLVASITRTWRVFWFNNSKYLLPNVELLRELGVPNSHIVSLLKNYPQALVPRNNEFVEIVKQVKEMGFDTEKWNFVLAVKAISEKNKVIWERCYEAYINCWGWSHDEVMMAFRKHPHCMILSDKKLMKGMRYLVDEMGLSANSVARCPLVLSLSHDKRIKPRCRVVQVLTKKGVISKNDVNFSTILKMREDHFLGKFVQKYLEQVPQLLTVYKGEISVSDE